MRVIVAGTWPPVYDPGYFAHCRKPTIANPIDQASAPTHRNIEKPAMAAAPGTEPNRRAKRKATIVQSRICKERIQRLLILPLGRNRGTLEAEAGAGVAEALNSGALGVGALAGAMFSIGSVGRLI